MVTSRNSRTISRFVFVLFACLMASGCEPQDADCAPSEKVCDEGDYDADLDRCILDDEVVVDESGQPLQATCPVSSGTADCLDSEKTCAVGVYNPDNERCEMGVGPALDERGNVVQPLCPQQESEGFEQAAGSSGDEALSFFSSSAAVSTARPGAELGPLNCTSNLGLSGLAYAAATC